MAVYNVLLVMTLTVYMYCVAGPLEDYVHRYDPAYKYHQIAELHFDECIVYTLNMTSQTWKPDLVPTHPVWWHYLVITIPKTIRNYTTAFLYIGEGHNTPKIPDPGDTTLAMVRTFAVNTGCTSAVLLQNPNQPIVFKDDPSHKRWSEDGLIAWTWRRFMLETPNDPEILLRMPMTKATVRAMDTITNFTNKIITKFAVNKFMIAGASKRGWTTWTTAAVDKRVIAACPLVMDLLNLQKSLHHIWKAYGGWSFAFKAYYNTNFTAQLDNPNFQKMAAIIDPLEYKEKLTMPKLVVSTTGDEFFLPDDSHYYFSQMTSPTYLRMIPNAEHSMIGHQHSVLSSLEAFFQAVVHERPLPQMKWELSSNNTGGSIVVRLDESPSSVVVYHAKTLSSRRRDFRLFVKGPFGKTWPQPILWFSSIPQQITKNVFKAEFQKPSRGWLAFFIQVAFPSVEGSVLEFTTETNIIPNTFPFEDCTGQSCRGKLL